MTDKPDSIKEEFAKSSSDISLRVPANVSADAIAVGKIYVYENGLIPPSDTDQVFGYDPISFADMDPDIRQSIQDKFIKEQSERYEEARKLLIQTYERHYKNVCSNMMVEMEGDCDKMLEAEIAMVKSDSTASEILAEIAKGKTAEVAAANIYGNYIEVFKAMDDPALASKAELVEQQLATLQHHLHPDKVMSSLDEAPEGAVIFCKSIAPVDVINFMDNEKGKPRFAGIICTEGSMEGHSAIIAKSLGIPYCIIDDSNLPNIKSGYDCIIDGSSREVILHPDSDMLGKYGDKRESKQQEYEVFEKRSKKSKSAKTLDGKKIHIFANFGTSVEAGILRKANVEGIGLYRSEMAENMRSSASSVISEDHWYKIFRQNMEACSDKEGGFALTYFRTLDIAGDKAGKNSDKTPEEKAAYERKVTITQMRSLLRLKNDLAQDGVRNKVKVMIPMISSPSDVKEMQELMDEQAADLGVETIKLGYMLEIPAIFDKLDELDADFVSIGSNDLIHGLLGVGRYGAESKDAYDPTDPAVLDAIEKAVEFSNSKNVPLSICGNMASNPRYTAVLVGAGIERLSTGIHESAIIKEVIRRIDSNEAAELFDELKSTQDRAGREAVLDRFNASRLGLGADMIPDIDWQAEDREKFTLDSNGAPEV